MKRLLLSGENLLRANKVILETLNMNVCNKIARRSLKETEMKAKTKVKKLLLTTKYTAVRLSNLQIGMLNNGRWSHGLMRSN